MELNEEQKASVARWYADGATLDEMQKRIKTDFGVHVTYFDLRMLVADLPPPVENEEPAAESAAEESDIQPSADAPQAAAPQEAERDDDAGEALPVDETSQEATPIDVSVTVDQITIPGTMASGDVTFSDGKTGKWYLDQMGRLGLGGDGLPPGYRPSQPDMVLFQQRLMETLQSRGLC